MVITKNNFHEGTKAEWLGISDQLASDLLEAFFKNKRKRNSDNFIIVDNEEYEIIHFSQKKSSFWRSRSNSFYFRKKGSRSVIRISDHWSKSDAIYSRSKKKNCSFIRSCYWSIRKAIEFEMNIPCERYPVSFLAGKCSYSNFN